MITERAHESGRYLLSVRNSRPDSLYRYDVQLRDPDGRLVGDSFTDTVLGARWWARRVARRNEAERRNWTFEVRP